MAFLKSNRPRFHAIVGAVVFFTLTMGVRPEVAALEQGGVFRTVARSGRQLAAIAKNLVRPVTRFGSRWKARTPGQTGSRSHLRKMALSLAALMVITCAYGCVTRPTPRTVPSQFLVRMAAVRTVKGIQVAAKNTDRKASIAQIAKELKEASWIKSRLNNPTDQQYAKIAEALLAGKDNKDGWNDPDNPYQLDAFGQALKSAAEAEGLWLGADY